MSAFQIPPGADMVPRVDLHTESKTRELSDSYVQFMENIEYMEDKVKQTHLFYSQAVYKLCDSCNYVLNLYGMLCYLL